MQNLMTYLIQREILDRQRAEQIKNEAYSNKRTFFRQLETMQIIPEEQLVKLAMEVYEMQSVLEDDISVKFDSEGTKNIWQLAEFDQTEAFCVDIAGKRIYLIGDPENTPLIEKIRERDMTAQFAICAQSAAKKIYRRIIQPEVIKFRAEKLKNVNIKFESVSTSNSEPVQFFHQLLQSSIAEHASDLQIIPLADHAAVSMRVDGKNRVYTTIPLNVSETLKNILINEANIGNVHPNTPIEGKMRYCDTDIRINIIPSRIGSDINLRFLSSKIYTFDELGISEDFQVILNRLFRMTKGLVVFVGPTGSGKSTTMYAGLSSIKDTGRKICAAEDPVEILLPSVTQIDISKNLSYADAVQSFLRHDSDVIVIGETRSEEVAAQVLRAAETGQLTFTTLHTNDALSAISRLVGLKVDPYVLGGTLSAIVSQRLVRRVCPHCAEEYELPQNHEWRKVFTLGNDKIILKRSKGCAECGGTGYLGRLPINEIITSNSELSSAVQRLASRAELGTIVRKDKNYKTLLDDGVKKAMSGITTFEELIPFINDII